MECRTESVQSGENSELVTYLISQSGLILASFLHGKRGGYYHLHFTEKATEASTGCSGCTQGIVVFSSETMPRTVI